MSVGNESNVAIQCPKLGNDAIDAGRHLLRRFSMGTAMRKQIPVGNQSTNFDGGQTFVVPIIPFVKVCLYHSLTVQAGQSARFPSASTGTAPDVVEANPIEPLPEFAGLGFAG